MSHGILVKYTDSLTGVGIYQMKRDVIVYSGCCLYRVELDTDANIYFCTKCGCRTKVQPDGLKPVFMIYNTSVASEDLAWWVKQWTGLEVEVNIEWSSTSS